VKSISELDSRESISKSNLTKGYVRIFILCVVLFIIAFILTTIISFLPSDFGDPEDYLELTGKISSVSTLLQSIGILLFSLSTFLGAITDDRISKEVKRGMAIASAIGIVALVIFNRMIINLFVV